MQAPGFARVDGFGNLVASQSRGVIGMKQAEFSNGNLKGVHRAAAELPDALATPILRPMAGELRSSR